MPIFAWNLLGRGQRSFVKVHADVVHTHFSFRYALSRIDVGDYRSAGAVVVSRILIEVQASLLPPRHLRRDPGSFTPDHEGLVSTFSVLGCCDEMTAGVEGVVGRRM